MFKVLIKVEEIAAEVREIKDLVRTQGAAEIAFLVRKLIPLPQGRQRLFSCFCFVF